MKMSSKYFHIYITDKSVFTDTTLYGYKSKQNIYRLQDVFYGSRKDFVVWMYRAGVFFFFLKRVTFIFIGR